MSFQDKITNTGTSTIPSFSEQLYLKQEAAAKAQFDANLEEEVRRVLKLNNEIIPDKGTPEWDTFINDRITKFTINNTETNVISLDATVNGGVVEDAGTILVEWEGKGYNTIIQYPLNQVKTFTSQK